MQYSPFVLVDKFGERRRRQTACKPGSVRDARSRDGHSSGTRLAARLARPTRAAGRECPCVTKRVFTRSAAGRPYSVLLPVGFALPPLLPGARCALAAPFHPCPEVPMFAHGGPGGLFSVALSLGSPPPAVSRHRIPVEPGLSSNAAEAVSAAVRPSGGKRDALPPVRRQYWCFSPTPPFAAEAPAPYARPPAAAPACRCPPGR